MTLFFSILLFGLWIIVDVLIFDSTKNVTTIQHASGFILYILVVTIITTILILI